MMVRICFCSTNAWVSWAKPAANRTVSGSFIFPSGAQIELLAGGDLSGVLPSGFNEPDPAPHSLRFGAQPPFGLRQHGRRGIEDGDVKTQSGQRQGLVPGTSPDIQHRGRRLSQVSEQLLVHDKGPNLTLTVAYAPSTNGSASAAHASSVTVLFPPFPSGGRRRADPSTDRWVSVPAGTVRSSRVEEFVGQLAQLLLRLSERSPTLGGRQVAAPRPPGHHSGPRAQQPFGLHLVQGGIQRSRTDPIAVAGQFFGHPRAVNFTRRGVMEHVKPYRTSEELLH